MNFTLASILFYVAGVTAFVHFFIFKSVQKRVPYSQFFIRPFSNFDNFWLKSALKLFISYLWPIAIPAWAITSTAYYFAVTSQKD